MIYPDVEDKIKSDLKEFKRIIRIIGNWRGKGTHTQKGEGWLKHLNFHSNKTNKFCSSIAQ